MADLDTYHRKRDFTRSPEPRGNSGQRRSASRFVIHKHDASQLHYDLRLEENGVLRSWALPKGPSLAPGEKHLAVQVEDHPLDYGDFEGAIPEGYGAGTVMIWDRGEWHVTGKYDDDQIDFELDGSKLKGAWTLKRMRGRKRDSKQWLMIKRHDDDTAHVPTRLDDVSVESQRSMSQIAAESNASREARCLMTTAVERIRSITRDRKAAKPTPKRRPVPTIDLASPARRAATMRFELPGLG